MTPLRAKYIRDLVIRGRSKNTQKAYIRCVCDLVRYCRRSPELISYEEVTGWLHHLIKERQLSASSVNIAVSAVRFLYAITLGRETVDLMASVPHMKRATRRAEVYAQRDRSDLDCAQTAARPRAFNDGLWLRAAKIKIPAKITQFTGQINRQSNFQMSRCTKLGAFRTLIGD
jgi:site-specific recombinase XerD